MFACLLFYVAPCTKDDSYVHLASQEHAQKALQQRAKELARKRAVGLRLSGDFVPITCCSWGRSMRLNEVCLKHLEFLFLVGQSLRISAKFASVSHPFGRHICWFAHFLHWGDFRNLLRHRYGSAVVSANHASTLVGHSTSQSLSRSATISMQKTSENHQHVCNDNNNW